MSLLFNWYHRAAILSGPAAALESAKEHTKFTFAKYKCVTIN